MTTKKKGLAIKALPAVSVIVGLNDHKALGRVIARRRAQLAHTTPDGLDKFGSVGLAGRLRLSPSTIYRVEAGDRWPSFQVLAPILKALGLELAIAATDKGADLGNL